MEGHAGGNCSAPTVIGGEEDGVGGDDLGGDAAPVAAADDRHSAFPRISGVLAFYFSLLHLRGHLERRREMQ